MDASSLLTKEFLEMRCRLIDLAAGFDRIERAPGNDALRSDRRFIQLREAARLLADDKPDRTARMQVSFSDSYEPMWRERLGI